MTTEHEQRTRLEGGCRVELLRTLGNIKNQESNVQNAERKRKKSMLQREAGRQYYQESYTETG